MCTVGSPCNTNLNSNILCTTKSSSMYLCKLYTYDVDWLSAHFPPTYSNTAAAKVGQTNYTRRVKDRWTPIHTAGGTHTAFPTHLSKHSYSRTGQSIGPHVNTSPVYFRTGRRIILGKRIDTPFWYQLVYHLLKVQGGEGFLLRFKLAVIVPITTFMVDQFLFNPSLPWQLNNTKWAYNTHRHIYYQLLQIPRHILGCIHTN